jgi:hypothetical protein
MERIFGRIFTDEKSISVTKTIVEGLAITISFASLYFILCMLNPTLAQSNLVGIFGKSFKVANLLRAFVLWNPMSAVGMFLGSQMFDSATARAFVPVDVLGMAQVGLGFSIWGISKKIGRTWYKDIALLALYGVLGSLIMSVNVAVVAGIMQGTGLSNIGKIFKEIIWFKVWSKTLLFIGGYPLLKLFMRGKDETNSTAE